MLFILANFITLSLLDIKDDFLISKVIDGGKITPNRHVNLPGISVKLPGLSISDRHDLEFAKKHKMGKHWIW